MPHLNRLILLLSAFTCSLHAEPLPTFAGPTPGTLRDITIPTVDISGDTQRQVVIARGMAKASAAYGHYVAWAGTYADIFQRREGQYRLKLLHNAARTAQDAPGVGNTDCGYSDLELLPTAPSSPPPTSSITQAPKRTPSSALASSSARPMRW